MSVGSFPAYGAGLESPDEGPQELTGREIGMITRSFQCHLATVTPSGWPYVQYRSGPHGFLHHLGGSRIGFPDFRGNRQFVSAGNIDDDARVSLFLADYPRKQRLKLFGRASVIEAHDDEALMSRLRWVADGEIASPSERAVVIEVEAFDWNCSRSLVPQYTAEQVRERVQPYIDQIGDLQREIEKLKGQLLQ
ncbi:pyridoxamine 5'-phosphate oxidase family protein [Gordonia sp. DT30]|uniref:pyridoxamine 5'-phosphate oxidase family protein n=1 Tax=Gordonia sp. DT30 TaxID=3416546 RepID=UPI003CFB0B6B